MMAAATMTRVNHLLFAGITYHGASGVAVARIASSYAVFATVALYVARFRHDGGGDWLSCAASITSARDAAGAIGARPQGEEGWTGTEMRAEIGRAHV